MTELEAVHRYSALAGEAEHLGLELSAARLQFVLREKRTQQVYACCATLAHVDEALRGRRSARVPGGQTRPLQGLFQRWTRSVGMEDRGDSAFGPFNSGGRD